MPSVLSITDGLVHSDRYDSVQLAFAGTKAHRTRRDTIIYDAGYICGLVCRIAGGRCRAGEVFVEDESQFSGKIFEAEHFGGGFR
jgi:hypothetical protein